MELVMATDLAKVMPKEISFNYAELKEQLAERLKTYQNMVVTEESLRTAKADRATLNKLRTALDEKRKDVKRECLKPFAPFEEQVSELTKMISEPIECIDMQTKVFADQKKQEKQGQIQALYLANIGELREIISFEKISNPKWLNVTYKMADIADELIKIIRKIKNDLAVIAAMNLDCGEQMQDVYIRTLDMSAAMTEKTRWEQHQKRIREYEKKATPVAESEPQEKEKPIVRTQQTKPVEAPNVTEALKTISVTFEDTTAAFRKEMSALCKQYGINYRWTNKEDIE